MNPHGIPAFKGNISFNAQHSPMGAFMSFTCGQFGSRGGFGLQIGRPGNQNLYIGVKDGDRASDTPIRCLPFYEGAVENAASAFQVGQNEPNKKTDLAAFTREQIKRHYGWATDRWVAGPLTFTIYTPFGTLPEASSTEQAYRLLPAVVATLELDNTTGQSPKTACFAMQFRDAGARMIHDGLDDAIGFAWRREMGAAAQLASGSADVFPIMRWTPNAGLANASPIHGLGNCPGVGFTVAAGQKATLRLVLGVHLDGIVTTGIEGSYLYRRFYPRLEAVLNAGLANADRFIAEAQQLDATLASSKLNADQQFLIAHATRSYYGSTQLLDVGGKPFWIVNEGEYCMLNTLDLSVDHVFWELKQNPWVVRNLLNNFVANYSYIDDVCRGDKRIGPGGISFCHDMGVHNNLMPKGHSSYELANLNALCFSYMTAEELCNWILMAACYHHATGDNQWVKENAQVMNACLISLINRGGESGFVEYDSSRCNGGAEITTYDSLDHSLAQTRNNVYMAVKCWASYLGLARLLASDLPERSALATAAAKRVEANVLCHVNADGVFPAVFEKDNAGSASRILPAIEGLMYPLYWGGLESSPFVAALKTHTLQLLNDPQRRNHFTDGGIKLSSTSDNSWMSKIAIFMHVCRKALGLNQDAQIKADFAAADTAHRNWQVEGDSAYWACSDQMVKGVAKGSKYYPRIITAALWMD